MAQSKRQTTHAKREREQAVRERRARKLQKKEERKQAAAEGTTVDENAIPEDAVDDETPGAQAP
jgi:hypothetical protein